MRGCSRSLWFVLLLSAGIVWGFVFLFADRAGGAVVQSTLIGAVTAMLVSGLLLVNCLDYPYTEGAGSLQPGRDGTSARPDGPADHDAGPRPADRCDADGNPLPTS